MCARYYAPCPGMQIPRFLPIATCSRVRFKHPPSFTTFAVISSFQSKAALYKPLRPCYLLPAPWACVLGSTKSLGVPDNLVSRSLRSTLTSDKLTPFWHFHFCPCSSLGRILTPFNAIHRGSACCPTTTGVKSLVKVKLCSGWGSGVTRDTQAAGGSEVDIHSLANLESLGMISVLKDWIGQRPRKEISRTYTAPSSSPEYIHLPPTPIRTTEGSPRGLLRAAYAAPIAPSAPLGWVAPHC